jgi:hypothetical protein
MMTTEKYGLIIVQKAKLNDLSVRWPQRWHTDPPSWLTEEEDTSSAVLYNQQKSSKMNGDTGRIIRYSYFNGPLL